MRTRRAVLNLVVGAAVAAAVNIGVAGPGAAPAGADPSAFGALSCGCQPKGPVGSQVRRDEIARGIRQSLADWSPGSPRNSAL